LSVEPLLAAFLPPLARIHWVIGGGGGAESVAHVSKSWSIFFPAKNNFDVCRLE
jgi:hypothetical protein